MTEAELTSHFEDAIRVSNDFYSTLSTYHQIAIANHLRLIYPATDPRTNPATPKELDIIFTNTRNAIPLPNETDFKGWTFHVITATGANAPTADKYLFKIGKWSNQAFSGIEAISKSAIDLGNFTEEDTLLRTGLKLVVLTDSTLWTRRRTTPDTYYQQPSPWAYWTPTSGTEIRRSDVLLVKDGMAVNKPISPYGTMQTEMVDTGNYRIVVYPAEEDAKVVQNVKLRRDATCSKIVNLLYVQNLNNLTIQNVEVTTPPNTKTNDKCITIANCTNVTIRNFSIDRTYSQEGNNTHGYALELNNIWNLKLDGIIASSPIWGMMGGNNLSKVLLKNSTINRMDIHCYGRDLVCENCTFQNDKYAVDLTDTYHIANRFSSFYGTLSYINCIFNGFIPFRTDYTYNIYTGCDILFKDCTKIIRKKNDAYLFEMGFWGAPLMNPRQEHIVKCGHNVCIDNFTFVIKDQTNIPQSEKVTEIPLFFLKDRQSFTESMGYTTYISVCNISIEDENGQSISNIPFRETNQSVQYVHCVRRFKDGYEVNSF